MCAVRYKQIHYLLRRPFIFEIVLVIIVIIQSKSKEKYVLYIPFRKNLKHWLKCKIKQRILVFLVVEMKPGVVRRVTCCWSPCNTAIKGPCDLTRISPFGSLTCLKLFGIPLREWITVPVAKVSLFLRSCISLGLVNQLSIVTWWWSPKWGLIKSITNWYLETYFAISASDAYTSYLRNTIYVTVISPEDVLFEKVTHK